MGRDWQGRGGELSPYLYLRVIDDLYGDLLRFLCCHSVTHQGLHLLASITFSIDKRVDPIRFHLSEQYAETDRRSIEGISGIKKHMCGVWDDYKKTHAPRHRGFDISEQITLHG